MNIPDPDFTDETLANLLDVSVEVIDAWLAKGVGPEFHEEQTPQGVKRLYTTAAVRAFCLKHRTFPNADDGAARAGRRAASAGPLIGGGAFGAPQ